jgi:hypothetical protein
MSDQQDNRLRGPLDVGLHLLDRQITDCDGLMAGKVDDVELSELENGALAVTGLLLGAPAFLPRLGHRLGPWALEKYRELGITRAGRTVPGRIELRFVERLTSEIRLNVPREKLIVPQQPPEGHVLHHRFHELLGMQVRLVSHEDTVGRIMDARMEPQGDTVGDGIPLTELLVGRGWPRSLLGYDRNDARGPVMIGAAVRRLHRGSGQIAMDKVERIDWAGRTVLISQQPAPLRSS